MPDQPIIPQPLTPTPPPDYILPEPKQAVDYNNEGVKKEFVVPPSKEAIGEEVGGGYNPLQVPPIELPRQTPLFLLPPAVAITDKLIPRYKIVPIDEYLYQEGSFNDAASGSLRIGQEDVDEAFYKSLLGNPVYSTLEFPQTGPLAFWPPVGELALQRTGVSLRIDMAIVEINQTKNIIRTAIAGRNGTIKEYIGLGDYEINITGGIVSKYNTYPLDEVQRLLDILSISAQIPIAGGLFELFNIDWVIIDEFKIRETEGTRNIVPFTIRCSSDRDDTIVIGSNSVIW
jgi:hypothetical protein